MCGCVVLALVAPATAIPAAAEEAGQWFGRAVLVTLSSKSRLVGNVNVAAPGVLRYWLHGRPSRKQLRLLAEP